MKIKLQLMLTPLIFLVACAGVETRSSQWHSLKPLKKYSMSDFKLRQDVNYLEVRQYIKSTVRPHSGKIVITPYSFRKYSVLFKVYNNPLTSFDKKTVSDFKALNPVLNDKANIKRLVRFGMRFSNTALGNAFYIDSNKKMGVISKKENVFPLLGEINTPAEAQLALWLHDKPEGKSYRKVNDGYTLIVEYNNSIANHSSCGWFKYQAHISATGKLLEYKLLEKKPSVDGCVVYD